MRARDLLLVLGGVVLAGAAVFAYIMFRPAGLGGQKGMGGGGPQSPVRIVGGSMKLRAAGGWSACPKTPNCVVSVNKVDSSALALDGVISAAQGGAEEPIGWTGANVSWNIQVWARDLTGTKQGNGYLYICTSDAAGNCTQRSPGPYITITTMGKSAGDPHTYSIGLQLEAMDTAAGRGYRYYDSSAQYNNFVEYIYGIQIQKVDSTGSTYAYKCPDGACNIYIGQ